MLIVNYSGHGNPNVWAHESIFEVNTSIPQLVNADRLALFFLATCNFSQFDDPKAYTGSELLMNKRDGGAMGVISASRKVYAAANATLNQGTFRGMFGRDAFGRVASNGRPPRSSSTRPADNFENDQKFFYMGDPTMRLAVSARVRHHRQHQRGTGRQRGRTAPIRADPAERPLARHGEGHGARCAITGLIAISRARSRWW